MYNMVGQSKGHKNDSFLCSLNSFDLKDNTQKSECMKVFISMLVINTKKLEIVTCHRIKWANKIGKCYSATKVIIWKSVNT